MQDFIPGTADDALWGWMGAAAAVLSRVEVWRVCSLDVVRVVAHLADVAVVGVCALLFTSGLSKVSGELTDTLVASCVITGLAVACITFLCVHLREVHASLFTPSQVSKKRKTD